MTPAEIIARGRKARVRKMDVGAPGAGQARVVRHGEEPHRAAPNDTAAQAANHEAATQPGGAQAPQQEEQMPQAAQQLTEDDLRMLLDALRSGRAKLDDATIQALRNAAKGIPPRQPDDLDKAIQKLRSAVQEVTYASSLQYGTSTYSMPTGTAPKTNPDTGASGGRQTPAESAVAQGGAPTQPEQSTAELHKAAVAAAARGVTFDEVLPPGKPYEFTSGPTLVAHGPGAKVVKVAAPRAGGEPDWSGAGLALGIDLQEQDENRAGAHVAKGGIDLQGLQPDRRLSPEEELAFEKAGFVPGADLAEGVHRASRAEAVADLLATLKGR